jgi:hypothetical protein
MNARTTCLPFTVATRCGYCGRNLTVQPLGDAACTPCRDRMARMVTGPSWGDLVTQFAAFQRAAVSPSTDNKEGDDRG